MRLKNYIAEDKEKAVRIERPFLKQLERQIRHSLIYPNNRNFRYKIGHN